MALQKGINLGRVIEDAAAVQSCITADPLLHSSLRSSQSGRGPIIHTTVSYHFVSRQFDIVLHIVVTFVFDLLDANNSVSDRHVVSTA